MNDIVLAGGRYPRLDAAMLRGLFAFRHQVFFRRLAWEVQSHDELEFDFFDTMNPVYMVAKGGRGEVEGCWRLMPTTDDYMLKDTFPQLLQGQAAPTDPSIWELSRFAVNADGDGRAVQAPLGPVTLEMIRKLYDFALENRIEQFVTVTSVALERLLRRTGLPIRRLGDGRAQRVGRVLTVACRVDVNRQFADVVYPRCTDDAHRAA